MINNLKATVCSFDYLRAIPFNLDTPQHFSLVYHNALPEKKATFLAKPVLVLVVFVPFQEGFFSIFRSGTLYN